MKKIIFSLIASAALLTACDPSTDSKEWSGHKTESFTIQTKQYDLNEDGTYTEAAEGNYIEYFTSPSTIVDVYYVTSKGVEMTLSKGKASGMVELKPARGSEPLQTLYFKTREMDGSSVTMETKVTVTVATDLSPEVKLLASNSGTKKWKWMPTEVNGGACWGNAGYGAGAQAGDGTINGAWWGCGPVDLNCPNTFADQLSHSAEGKLTGEEYSTSYMEFTEDGLVNKYDLDGAKLNKTDKTWSITKGATHAGIATLNTAEGAILWPYSINTGGGQPTSFEVGYASSKKLVLIWAADGTGDWSECTWWSFGAK